MTGHYTTSGPLTGPYTPGKLECLNKHNGDLTPLYPYDPGGVNPYLNLLCSMNKTSLPTNHIPSMYDSPAFLLDSIKIYNAILKSDSLNSPAKWVFEPGGLTEK